MFVEVDDKDEKEDRDPEILLFEHDQHYETIDDSTTGKETKVFFKLTSTLEQHIDINSNTQLQSFKENKLHSDENNII